MLDLVSPPQDTLERAVALTDLARRRGTVLVCCALGFQRSAAIIADWLVVSGRSHTAAQARKKLAASGRPVHLHAEADKLA
jgi:protein-tyrosine phosphatase